MHTRWEPSSHLPRPPRAEDHGVVRVLRRRVGASSWKSSEQARESLRRDLSAKARDPFLRTDWVDALEPPRGPGRHGLLPPLPLEGGVGPEAMPPPPPLPVPGMSPLGFAGTPIPGPPPMPGTALYTPSSITPMGMQPPLRPPPRSIGQMGLPPPPPQFGVMGPPHPYGMPPGVHMGPPPAFGMPLGPVPDGPMLPPLPADHPGFVDSGAIPPPPGYGPPPPARPHYL